MYTPLALLVGPFVIRLLACSSLRILGVQAFFLIDDYGYLIPILTLFLLSLTRVFL